jgi:hypothetical protein
MTKKKVVMKRKISAEARMKDRENALKGTEKWKNTPTGARKAERVRGRPKWGFDGKSPKTRKRKYGNKRKR